MKLTLINKKLEAIDTVSFVFDKPVGFDFQAGQYIYITLPKLNYPDERGVTRHFTISSSPTEAKIQITTRIRQESGYKKTLNELPIRSEIETRGSFGNFVFTNHHSPVTNHVFLAGGIGITPFRSMIKYNIDAKLNIPIHLIYSNSDNDFVFKKELNIWQNENNFLKVTYFDPSVSGHFDAVKLSNLLIAYNLLHITCWLVGPNMFVNAMEEILEKLKVPEDNIRTEKFTGY